MFLLLFDFESLLRLDLWLILDTLALSLGLASLLDFGRLPLDAVRGLELGHLRYDLALSSRLNRLFRLNRLDLLRSSSALIEELDQLVNGECSRHNCGWISDRSRTPANLFRHAHGTDVVVCVPCLEAFSAVGMLARGRGGKIDRDLQAHGAFVNLNGEGS